MSSLFRRAGRFPGLLLALTLILCSGLPLARLGAVEEGRRSFALAGGRAEETLETFSEQAGVQIVFLVEDVRGVATRPVRGVFAVREALDRLIADTPLVVRQDGKTGAFVIKRERASQPPPAASGEPARSPQPTADPPKTMKSKNPFAALGAWLALALAPAHAADSTAATGAIEGRVLNATAGTYVSKARVVIDALRLETLTDGFGQYHFSNVPAGEVKVRAIYTGLPPQLRTVNVPAGGRAEANFELRLTSEEPDVTVKLDAFTVAAGRDMAASDIAVNEQRYAPGIRNVVSTDSFGDFADGNVGEFAKYLPGVVLNRSGSDGINMSLGGVPPSGTPITVDGNALASAASSAASRTIEFENLAIGGMSRVEVSRSQNPDNPANAIGGSVNLVSKSAFERTRPLYTLRSYLSFRAQDFSLSKQPGPFAKKQYPFEPNFEFTGIVPLTRNLGFSVNALVARTPNNGPGTNMDWVPTVAGQSANYPATTPDQPYLARYRLSERPKITVRESVSLNTDWRVSDGNVLSVGLQYAFFTSSFWVRQLNFDVGRVASFGPDFTQGAPGAGFAQIMTDARDKTGTSYMTSLRYKHTGRVWEWTAGGAFSAATNHYANKGWFQSNNAFFRGLTLRFEKFDYDHPQVLSAKDASGADVNPYNLANYNLETVTGLNSDSSDFVRSLYANARRDFALRVPVTVKVGLDYRAQTRDMRRPTTSASFVGADGKSQTADDNAFQFFDPIYSGKSLVYGPKMQWFDLGKIGRASVNNPTYFAQSETNLVNDYRSNVTTSQAVGESIVAPYLRLDTKLFSGRLQITGGVRYERTDDQGYGPVIDPTRVYQRDAGGKIVRDPAGKPVVVAPLNTLAGTRLAYLERAAKIKASSDGYFPTLNASHLLRQNLILRASYGRSINRPDFGTFLPSISLPDTEGTGRSISLSNGELKPWIADSYGLAVEYYFNEPSGGVLSARVYRRDISDFWGTVTVPASDAVLEPWGLDPAVYGEALGYTVTTTRNVGAARVSGTEFDYRQNLAFLPRWARGFTVFGNLTLQHLVGSEQASFSGFVGRTINYGVTFSRERFTARIAMNLRGLVKQGQVTNAGVEPGTFVYLAPRNSMDASVEYRFTRTLSVFLSGRNVNSAMDDTLRYGPSTPGPKRLNNRAPYGATLYFGVKGTF